LAASSAPRRRRDDDARARRVGLFGGDHRRGAGAIEIQIWTDVDGMLTADPRIIRDVHVVPHLSFAKRRSWRISAPRCCIPRRFSRRWPQHSGAHPEFAAAADSRGTLVTRIGRRPRPLTAVASKNGVTVVDIRPRAC
jgi:hypothetical protein